MVEVAVQLLNKLLQGIDQHRDDCAKGHSCKAGDEHGGSGTVIRLVRLLVGRSIALCRHKCGGVPSANKDNTTAEPSP
jgi:hypothetical protein